MESLRSLAGENCTFGRNALLHVGEMLSANGSQCDQWLLLDVLNTRACEWGFQSCVVRRSGAQLWLTVCQGREGSDSLPVSGKTEPVVESQRAALLNRVWEFPGFDSIQGTGYPDLILRVLQFCFWATDQQYNNSSATFHPVHCSFPPSGHPVT